MNGAQRILAGALCVLMPAVAAEADDLVVRRNGAESLRGSIVLVDDAGVTIRIGAGASHLVSWDQIRRVESAESMRQVSQWTDVAENVWRARSRLERGDTWLAEPLFDELFRRYRRQTNEMALIVAEGLLRCHLARQAHAAAMVPALEMIRLRRSGVTTDRYGMLPPVYNAELALCPALPPFWAELGGLEALAQELDAYEPGDDAVTEAIVDLYRAAVAFARGEEQTLPLTVNLPRHPGVEYLRDLLAARDRDPERRTSAQVRVMRSTGNLPEWTEAWSRYSIGMALLNDRDIRSQDRGLVHLAHLPARFSTTQPYLAGMALDRMADVLDERGDAATPSLRLELERRFPHHPVLDERAYRSATFQATSAQ